MFNGYCPLMQKEVHEGICIEILAELGKGKKEEHVKEIRKNKSLTNDDMDKVCKKCSNYSF